MADTKAILVVTAALLCFIQVLEADLVRRSTDTSSTVNELQEAATKARQALSNAATEVSQVLGLDNLPAPETLASELHNQTLNFARTVGQFVGQLQNEITAHRSDLSNLLQSVADQWNETATSLQAYTPEVRKTARELQTSFNSGLQLFFEQAQKLVDAVGPNARAISQNVQEITRTALDRVRETADEFRTSLQETTQNQPEH
ncbi:hypothetical protein B7P43_G01376 [Cryptotermes secundus]|uniref:Apolipophorin-III n=1 Tax=Cryptotermes secundus TaxID=105785 RepID=A0A2J7PRC6_9NEOP|nr:uncharacterized protein LOC111872308 [Cryptotermes secundus]PNF18884.1 hypothetical protein B7P43_G01376 [Cryptotermes secundus]